MLSLFSPNLRIYEIYHPPPPEKVLPQKILPKYIYFNQYLTRSHLINKLNVPFLSYFDSSTKRYYSWTGTILLELLNKLIYLFGKTSEEHFPQSYHSVWLFHNFTHQNCMLCC